MTEQLVSFFVDHLGGTLAAQGIVFVVSLFPILELRGGILAGYALGVSLLESFPIAFVGNILPIPFILILINAIFRWMKKTPLAGLVNRIEKRTLAKKTQIERFGYFGLYLFVAIPLPGTGAWTGALLSCLLNMQKGKSFLAILLGVLTAGIIVSILSYGLLASLGIG